MEHLIFGGSEGYPERGYLDRLANLCQGAGTNAYTSEDHTCYTFTTSSLPGLLCMLPVFLDHIFRPLLDPLLVKREIFHRAASDDQAKGVVYCEMAARQWSEQDQMDLGLRQEVLGLWLAASPDHDRKLDGYRWECGGLTSCLIQLKREEIVEYHERFYRPDRTTIIVCGGTQELELNMPSILNILEQVQFRTPLVNPDFELNSANELVAITVPPSNIKRFPAADESLGSVGLAWMGPPSDDLYTITALHVLMRMLRESSASPLYQEFVERAQPIATDIDYEIKPYHTVIITLIFSGISTLPVPLLDETDTCDANDNTDDDNDTGSICYLKNGVLKDQVICFLSQWLEDKESLRMRRDVALKSLTLKLQESLEDDPHELCASFCMPEIVRRYWNGRETTNYSPYGWSLSNLPQYLSQLENEPLLYWSNLLKKYILNNQVADIYLHPSRTMADELKMWETEDLKGIEPIDLVPDLPSSTIQPIPLIQLTLPTRVRCKFEIQEGRTCRISLPTTALQRYTLAKDLSSVPKSLLPGLVLLQELLFATDVEINQNILDRYPLLPPTLLSKGLITYQELLERLGSQFTLMEAAVGFDNELFSTGYLDSHLLISLNGRVPYKLKELRALALVILEGSVFETHRVEEVVENLLNQLKDAWRDPSQVLETFLLEKLDKIENINANREIETGEPLKRAKRSPSNFADTAINLISQIKFLQEASRLLEQDPQQLISALESLRKNLVEAPFIECHGCDSKAFHEQDDDENKVESHYQSEPVQMARLGVDYSLPKYGYLEKEGINLQGKIDVFPMADITASFFSIIMPLNVLPHPNLSSIFEKDLKKFLGAIIICQLVSYTEGPLYRRIRGGGLAYGASLSLSLWNGFLSFDLNDSTDPLQSLLIFKNLIQEILNEAKVILEQKQGGSLLNSETLQTAKALQLYQLAAERSTPASTVVTAFRCHLRGFPLLGSIEEENWNQILLSMTLTDIAQWSIEHLPAFLNPQHCIYLLAIPKSKLDEVKDGLEKLTYPFLINDLSPYTT